MRDYGHIPRPAIEDHYHIRDLIEAQEKRAAERTYYQDRDKANAELMDEIKKAPVKDTKEFWCESCQKEFHTECIKEVEKDWNNSSQYVAFYRSKCPLGHNSIRLITDKHKDSFFYRSKRLARDRGAHSADMLQSWETGFQLLYGRKNKD